MKTLIAALLLAATVISSYSQATEERLRQVKNKTVVHRKAPAEAISSFVAFFEYVKKNEPDIVSDSKGQAKWLTKSLQKKLMDNYAARVEYMSKNPDDKPEYPDNSWFLGVWNKPTNYSIIASRHYDYRNKDNPRANRTIIDVLYEWGNEDSVCNQYPGIRNLHSFVFVFEDGAWKLEDIYMFDDEFTSAESLSQQLMHRL